MLKLAKQILLIEGIGYSWTWTKHSCILQVQPFMCPGAPSFISHENGLECTGTSVRTSAYVFKGELEIVWMVEQKNL